MLVLCRLVGGLYLDNLCKSSWSFTNLPNTRPITTGHRVIANQSWTGTRTTSIVKFPAEYRHPRVCTASATRLDRAFNNKELPTLHNFSNFTGFYVYIHYPLSQKTEVTSLGLVLSLSHWVTRTTLHSLLPNNVTPAQALASPLAAGPSNDLRGDSQMIMPRQGPFRYLQKDT